MIDRPAAQLRLPYLDGLRAAAALYVVLFHAAVGFGAGDLPASMRNLRRVLSYGHDAVAVFIVLSGYCLMLPVVRADGHLVGGMSRYISRRAWRILPPYYATLAGSLLLLWALPVLQTRTGTIWDDTSPAFALGPIATHLLLVHNLVPAWASRINGPLWSVATEWQIYFLFPLLLLPAWRKAGSLATLLTAFAVGCLPIWLVPRVAGRWIPWYLGLFALGMCSAAVGFSARRAELAWLRRVPWQWFVRALAGCCLLGMTVLVKAWFRLLPLSDALVGATTAALLVYCTDYVVNPDQRRKPWALTLLEVKPLVSLGHWSYSLYLTHLPIVALCYFALRPAALSPQAHLLAMIAVGLPASLLCAFAFFVSVERHFIGRPWASFGRKTDLSSVPGVDRPL